MNGHFLPLDTVLILHTITLRENGGLEGIRDLHLLEAALARAQNIASYDTKCDIFDIAASVGFGIIRNHPFVDGNKRTGLLAMLEILRAAGKLAFHLSLPEESTSQVILAVARGEKTVAELATWLRDLLHKSEPWT
jgi:death-on-curing protein